MEIENKMSRFLGVVIILATIVSTMVFATPVFAAPPVPSIENATLVYTSDVFNRAFTCTDGTYMYICNSQGSSGVLSKVYLSNYTEVKNVSIGTADNVFYYNGVIYTLGNSVVTYYASNLTQIHSWDVGNIMYSGGAYNAVYFAPINKILVSTDTMTTYNGTSGNGVVSIDPNDLANDSSYQLSGVVQRYGCLAVLNDTVYSISSWATSTVDLQSSIDGSNWSTVWDFGDYLLATIDSSFDYLACAVSPVGSNMYYIRYLDLSNNLVDFNTTLPTSYTAGVNFISNDSLIFQYGESHRMYEFNCSTQGFVYLGQAPIPSGNIYGPAYAGQPVSKRISTYNSTILVPDFQIGSVTNVWSYNISTCSNTPLVSDTNLHNAICHEFFISNTNQIYQSQLNNSYTLTANSQGISDLSGLSTWDSLQYLSLLQNSIYNISCLVPLNSSLYGHGLVNLDILYNPLDANSKNVYIPELIANGTTVQYSYGNPIILPDTVLYQYACDTLFVNSSLGTVFTESDLNSSAFTVYPPAFSYPSLVAYNITNISYMTNMQVVFLGGEQISNVSELLNLPNLVFADLTGSPLDSYAFSYVIPALIAKGVSVTNDTPYVLTYTAANGGTISGLTTQYVGPTFNGTAVRAVPNSGGRFSSWSDGSTQNPRVDTNVNSDITVTANFTGIVNIMANIIAIVFGAVVMVILLGFAFVEAREKGLGEGIKIAVAGIIAIVVLELIIVACL
jgi:hypothetical protein